MITPDYIPNPFDAMVSLFPSHHLTVPSEHLPLGLMLGHLARGTYRASIEEARACLPENEELYKQLKGQLPAFTPTGTFRQRRNTGLQDASGLIHFDYDSLEGEAYLAARAALAADPHILYAFQSPSGRGIKCALVCEHPYLDAASYSHAWQVGLTYMQAQHPELGPHTDTGCKDLARLCYVSYDPELYVAAHVTPLPIPEQETPEDRHAHLWDMQSPWGLTEVSRMLDAIAPRNDDRDWWLTIGMALHSSGEPWARPLWDGWSGQVANYSQQDQDTAWKSFHADGKITMGTLVYLARQAGWNPLRARLKATRVKIEGGQEAPSGSTGQPRFDVEQGISAEELMRRMVVPARFLVPELVPDGLTILAAPAKSFKSYFSLSLALATIGATDWCGTFPTEERGNVVFFGLEAPPQQLRNRLHQLAPRFQPGAFPHRLTFFSGMRSLPPFNRGLQAAIEDVIAHYSPRLIVIDPLSYLYRLGRQDDLASATLDLLWPLAEMAASHGVAIFSAEHLRKRSKEDVSVVDQLAGSHIKAAVVHGLIMMRNENGEMVLETTMRDAKPRELVISINFDDAQHVVWGYKGTRDAVQGKQAETRKAQVYAVLQAYRRPWRATELIEHLGWPNTETVKASVRKILSLGANTEHVLSETKRGEYFWIGADF